MAAKKRRKKSKAKIAFFSFGFLNKKKKKTKQASWVGPTLISIVKVLAVVCFLAAIAVGLLYLEDFVKDTARSSETKVYLELADVPAWVGDQLQDKVIAVAGGDDGAIRFDEQAARTVRRNIKPLALIRSGVDQEHYVDVERVVLDFVPMPNLPIVEVAGLLMEPEMPLPGDVWRCDDLSAAITILDRMGQMDRSFTPDKPLLFEISCIDMSNFGGRKDSTQPHIVLYTKDNIEITWGAEWGKWQQYLESTDEEKLAKLYGYYKQYGTLSVGVKYINLRDPQDKIPLPIDKY